MSNRNDIIFNAASNAGSNSGVYIMKNAQDKPIYIGKAKTLKNRLSNYIYTKNLSPRISFMTSQVASVETIITSTENNALILEAELISKYQPKFNILLKDHKSFLYICIDTNHQFPRLYTMRSKNMPKKQTNIKIFGPFASSQAINSIIEMIQKIFLIRNCSDSKLEGVSKPCILHHIKRCSAPCTKPEINTSEDLYSKNVKGAVNFLLGKSSDILQSISKEMEEAAARENYEEAIRFREQIRQIQYISNNAHSINITQDADVLCILQKYNITMVGVIFYRNSISSGIQYFTLDNAEDNVEPKEALEAFITQYYSKSIPSKEILTNIAVDDDIGASLSQLHNIKITIKEAKSQKHQIVIGHILSNIFNKIEASHSKNAINKQHIKQLAHLLGVDTINNIEVYDNSHLSGTSPVGAMIMYGDDAFQKNNYRIFNMDKVSNTQDDYLMMKTMIEKRIKTKSLSYIPDLMIIDGGKGQLSSVLSVTKKFKDYDNTVIMACAKGKQRNAGKEVLFLEKKEPIILDETSALLHFIQKLRNEAHRFVIKQNRAKRSKNIIFSDLDGIQGIGKQRKQDLLRHFGSMQNILEANIRQIQEVPGIGKKQASIIIEYINNSNL